MRLTVFFLKYPTWAKLTGVGLGVGAFTIYGSNKKTVAYASANRQTQQLHQWKASAGTATPKRVVIVGAGIAGISSAYRLSKRGYEVVVIDSRETAAEESTAVTAGLMKKSSTTVNKAIWGQVFSNLAEPFKFWKKEKDFRYFHVSWFKAMTDPHFINWVIRFAYHGLWRPSSGQTQLKHMNEFRIWADSQIDDPSNQVISDVVEGGDVANRGSLMLTTGDPAPVNPPTVYLTNSEEIIKVEPYTAEMKPVPTLAEYDPSSTSGNSETFTQKLAEKLKNDPEFNVIFYFNTKLENFKINNADGINGVSALQTSNGEINTDGAKVLIAAGSWTPVLFWKLGLFVPVYPMKGYSCRIDDPEAQPSTKINGVIIDGPIYLSQLGKQLRISSIGEFDGWNPTPSYRVNELFREKVSKYGVNIENVQTACGLRPIAADGTIIVGQIDSWKNLYVNVGPGYNGWQIGLGGGELTARIIDGIEDGNVTWERSFFSPHGRVRSSRILSKLCLLRHGSNSCQIE